MLHTLFIFYIITVILYTIAHEILYVVYIESTELKDKETSAKIFGYVLVLPLTVLISLIPIIRLLSLTSTMKKITEEGGKS